MSDHRNLPEVLSVGALIELLRQFDRELPVVLSDIDRPLNFFHVTEAVGPFDGEPTVSLIGSEECGARECRWCGRVPESDEGQQ